MPANMSMQVEQVVGVQTLDRLRSLIEERAAE